MRYVFQSFVAGFLVFALTFVSLAEGGDPIKVGTLYNLTGGMAAIDVPGCNGAKLAAAQINAKGGILNGRPVELIVEDTETKPKLAEAAAANLVSQGVVAGVGYGDTTFVFAAAPVFQDRGIPFITSGATDPQLPRRVGNRLFMACFGDDDQAFAIADYAWQKLNVRSVVVWTDKSMEFTILLSRFFKDRFAAVGGKLLSEELFVTGTKDFSELVARLKAMKTKPDAIFISAVPNEAAATVTQIRKAGIEMPILSGDGFDSDLVTTVPGPKLADRIFFATHSYRGDTRPEVLTFVRDYKKKYGSEPENAFAALGYDAINLLADAIGRAGTTEPAAVSAALAATRSFHGVTGEISYTRPGRAPMKPISIIGVEEGKYHVLETRNPQP